MKKYFSIITLALAAMVSCNKVDELSRNEESVNPGNEAPAGKVLVSFQADMAVPVSEGSKTTVESDGTVLWEAGDEIEIWYLDASNNPKSFTAKAASAGKHSGFSGAMDEGDAPTEFWAAYPASAGELKYEDGAGKFYVTVKKTDGTFKSANIMAGYSTAEAMSFAFKNAVGIVRLALPANGIIQHNGQDYPIKTIRLKGKETSIHSMGTVEVVKTEGTVSGFVTATSGTQSAAVDIDDNVRTSGVVYLPSFPGELTNGFAVRYYSNKGQVPAVLTKDTPVTITRGNLKPLSDLTSRIVWDYYVSGDGSGDGLTAATPMGVEDFVNFLSEGKNGGTNVIMCYANRLNGSTFHFTPGTHDITAPITFPSQSIYSEATYYNVTGDGAATLDGGGSSQIFTITNPCDRTIVSDITLTNGSTATGGLVLIQNTSPLFKNCIFTNTTSDGAGGAVRVDTANKGSGSFESCTFSGCNGQNGGAFVITNAGTSASLKECTFSENSAGAGGGAFYSTNGMTTLDHCTFTSNTATTYGGAVYITTGTVHISEGTTFTSNTAETGGGAISINGNNGTAYIDACYFQGNQSALGGALYTPDKIAAKYYINGSTFKDNTVTGGNGHAIYLNTQTSPNFATLCINNSTLYNTENMTGSNASLVCNKGKTIVVNSTLYGTTSQWGTYALGCHKVFSDTKGCLLLNSIFVNTTSDKPAIFQTGANYYAIAKNCISSNTSANSQFTTSDIVSTVPTLNWSDDGYFSWNGSTTLPHLSRTDLETELSDEQYALGAAFLEWLKSLKYGDTKEYDALDVDIRGNARSGYIWAGAYQN